MPILITCGCTIEFSNANREIASCFSQKYKNGEPQCIEVEKNRGQSTSDKKCRKARGGCKRIQGNCTIHFALRVIALGRVSIVNLGCKFCSNHQAFSFKLGIKLSRNLC